MKKTMIPVSLLVVFLLVFSSCSLIKKETTLQIDQDSTDNPETEAVALNSSSDLFTDRDLEFGFDENSSTKIVLSGNSVSATSNAVQIQDNTVTVTDEGTYILSGSLNDGMVMINADDTDKIQLVLNGVSISNSTSAAIYIANADKVFLTTVSGSENTVANTGEYIALDENNIDAVIFSKADLTLNGEGSLSVAASAGHGIVSKDDLVFAGGTYKITAANNGVCGKNSIRIADGSFSVTAQNDAFHAENKDDASSGFLYIANGNFSIDAGGDGISAASYMQIDDGTFDISTGEGSASADMKTDDMGFGFREGNAFAAANEEDTTNSQKGLKANGTLTILKGSFATDTVDDSIHANSDILIENGEFILKSGDDAIHADASVTIKGGSYSIPYCYEGIEGQSITIDNGTFDINSEDDGMNASGGADSSGFGGRRPDEEQFNTDSEIYITINGGEFIIVSSGDCIDSNSALTINAGKLDLTCNGNGNTALDCDGAYSFDGADITTNDGSENNPGQMGGGMGAQGGMMQPPERR